ncbi:MAG: hypothetical protein OXG35_19165 [Acidobacteria bacterium]|nr:hypothetical protein [Acidobacteriota bacterium]
MNWFGRDVLALLDDDPGVQPWRSVASEASRQLDVEGVEVDIADALEQLGGWPTASAHRPGPRRYADSSRR